MIKEKSSFLFLTEFTLFCFFLNTLEFPLRINTSNLVIAADKISFEVATQGTICFENKKRDNSRSFKNFRTVSDLEIWCLCTVSFGQKVPKLNNRINRPVYCSRLYGNCAKKVYEKSGRGVKTLKFMNVLTILITNVLRTR